MTSRTARANWISERLPEEHRVRFAIAVYVLIAIVAIVVSGWLLLGAITVTAVSGALYARYTEELGRDEYVVDDGWRQQLFPVAGAFFVLACFALGGWPLVIVIALIAGATVLFRSRRPRVGRGTTENQRRARPSQDARRSPSSTAGESRLASYLQELEAARDGALAAIDERAIARERSLAVRKAASDGVDVDRLEQAGARLGQCERHIHELTDRLSAVEVEVAAGAEASRASERHDAVRTGEESSGLRPAIRLVEPDPDEPAKTFSVRADVAASVEEDGGEEGRRRLAGIAELERSLEERSLDLDEREANVRAMHEELEERAEQRDAQIELRIRELDAREAQLSDKEHELARYVAQAQNAIRRREAETRHEA